MTPLRQRFIEDLQLRNRSPKTIQAYVDPSAVSFVRPGGIANDLGATPTARPAAQKQGPVEYVMNLATCHDRSAKPSAKNAALALRAEGWPRPSTEYTGTGQEGTPTHLPRGRSFPGRYKGYVWKKQIKCLRWTDKSRYNTPSEKRDAAARLF